MACGKSDIIGRDDMKTSATDLADAHVHLADFVGETDVDELVSECIKCGIGQQLCMGTREEDWSEVQELSHKYAHIVSFIGVHPWFADKYYSSCSRLKDILTGSTYGVGEIGLDKLRGPDIAVQSYCFRQQLELGLCLQKPVSIHCVHAWGEMLDILGDYAPYKHRIAIHAYGGSSETLRLLERMEVMASFCGTVMQSERKRLMRACLSAADNTILIETDAPALLPRSDKNARSVSFRDGNEYNHPANLGNIYQYVSELRGIDYMDFTKLIRHNINQYLYGEQE